MHDRTGTMRLGLNMHKKWVFLFFKYGMTR